MLVNAAGFGKIGSYEDISLQDCNGMIDLNCRAAVDMTQVSLPFMSGGSRILEICSTAAFQPFQYLGIYAATKAAVGTGVDCLDHVASFQAPASHAVKSSATACG